MDFEERVAVAVTKLAAIEDIGDTAEKLVFQDFYTEGILAAELDDLIAIDGITSESSGNLECG